MGEGAAAVEDAPDAACVGVWLVWGEGWLECGVGFGRLAPVCVGVEFLEGTCGPEGGIED